MPATPPASVPSSAPIDAAAERPRLRWQDGSGQAQSALWHAESGQPPPRRVQLADDRLSADVAYKLASEGTALLWQGDFQNARHLLQALTRRINKRASRSAAPVEPVFPQAFHLHRQAQAQRARLLSMLLIPLDGEGGVPLRRAPDLREACEQAYGPAQEASVASLRELLGLIGAFEWRKKGVPIEALQARIHPHYGVFSPARGEYIDLVARAPLPTACQTVAAGQAAALDIGTGTGVLAAVLARRGLPRILATDQDPRALACARDNLRRLGLDGQVDVIEADLFPSPQQNERAPLVVCNPPWVPARPSCPIEYAVYDPDSRMLKAFLAGLASHLSAKGEGWLILSDLAEHLQLRSRDELLGWIEAAGLQVLGRLDTRPRHPKAQDATDPLHQARQAEVTSLWRLGVR